MKKLFFLLLNHTARANSIEHVVNDAFRCAIKGGQLRLCRSLMYYCLGNMSERERIAIFSKQLITASEVGKTSIVKELLNYQEVDVNYRDERGISALMSAAGMSFVKIVEMLLKRRARINATSQYEIPVLHIAVGVQNTEEVLDLLLMAPKVNIIAEFNFEGINSTITMLQFALHYGQTSNARVIVKHLVLRHFDNLDVICAHDVAVIEKHDELNDFFEKCKREIALLKREIAESCTVALYDILKSQCLDELAGYASNEIIEEKLLTTLDIESEFPIYSKLIHAQFFDGVVRKNLLKSSRNHLLLLFECLDQTLPLLPDTCLSKVLRYLSNDDLDNLREAFVIE